MQDLCSGFPGEDARAPLRGPWAKAAPSCALPDAKCFVRVLIGGVEGQPNGVNTSTFDSTRNVDPPFSRASPWGRGRTLLVAERVKA